MADKTPVKATFSGTTVSGLAEFVSTDTIPVLNGGTGLSAVGTAKQFLRVNSGGSVLEYANLDTLENDVDAQGNAISGAQLKAFNEGIATEVTATTGTTALDLSSFNVFQVDVQGTVTLNFTNFTASTAANASIILRNTTGTPAVSFQVNGNAVTPLTSKGLTYSPTTGGNKDLLGFVIVSTSVVFMNFLQDFQ